MVENCSSTVWNICLADRPCTPDADFPWQLGNSQRLVVSSFCPTHKFKRIITGVNPGSCKPFEALEAGLHLCNPCVSHVSKFVFVDGNHVTGMWVHILQRINTETLSLFSVYTPLCLWLICARTHVAHRRLVLSVLRQPKKESDFSRPEATRSVWSFRGGYHTLASTRIPIRSYILIDKHTCYL